MPHYDRNADPSAAQNTFENAAPPAIDQDAAESAAEALRAADIEAAQEEFDVAALKAGDLERMSIDELRIVARQLDVPDRGTITEKDQLITAIKRQL